MASRRAEGGTSLSSPLMVGQWARVPAKGLKTAVQKRGGLGFADEDDLPPGRERRLMHEQ